MVEHRVEVGSCIPARVGEAVAQLDIVDTLRMWGRVGTIVSKVVALRLAMAEGIGSVGIVASVVVAEARLGVGEVVALEDIERLVGIGTIVEGVELIVDAAGGKAHIAVLDIRKGLPGRRDVVGALQVDAHIVLVGRAVVVLPAAVGKDELSQLRMGYIGKIAVVDALEGLEGSASDEVPVAVLVVGVPDQAIGILREALLAHEVSTLEDGAIEKGEVGYAKLRELVVVAELIVVAVAVGVVDGAAGGPLLAELAGDREEVVVLPEIVRRARPERAVSHLVARSACRGVVGIVEMLVERIEAAQSHAMHVGIGEDACAHASIVPVEELARVDTIPRLPSLLVVANVLVADAQGSIRVHPGDGSIVASAVASCAMNVAIRPRMVVGSIEHEDATREADARQTRGEVQASVVGIVGTVGSGEVEGGAVGRGACGERDGTAKGTVAIRAGAHSTLDLHIAQQGGIGIGVGPKDALVLRRIEGDTIEGDVDAAVASPTDAHVGRARAQTVLAPCNHAWGAREEDGQLLSRATELLEFLLLNPGDRKGRVARCLDSFHHNLAQLAHLDGVRLISLGRRTHKDTAHEGRHNR